MGPTATAASDRGTCAMGRNDGMKLRFRRSHGYPTALASCRPQVADLQPALADPALAPEPFAGRGQGPRSPVILAVGVVLLVAPGPGLVVIALALVVFRHRIRMGQTPSYCHTDTGYRVLPRHARLGDLPLRRPAVLAAARGRR
jgi:hypothetical protein